MARFPKIDSPCPLDAAALDAVQGQCHVCDRQVHSLDGLDEPARRALLASANGPICVKYRVPAASRPAAGMGRVIAATLLGAGLAGAAHAGAPPADAAAANPPVAGLPAAAPLAPAAIPATAMLGVGQESTEELDIISVTGGGILVPGEAEWVELEDDSAVPDMPVVVRPADVR